MSEETEETAKKYDQDGADCFLLQYSLVLMAAGPYITGDVQPKLCETLKNVCEEQDVLVLNLKGGADFVQLTYACGPYLPPRMLADVLRKETESQVRQELPDAMPEGDFWKDSYLAVTEGDSDEVILEYLQEQHKD